MQKFHFGIITTCRNPTPTASYVEVRPLRHRIADQFSKNIRIQRLISNIPWIYQENDLSCVVFAVEAKPRPSHKSHDTTAAIPP